MNVRTKNIMIIIGIATLILTISVVAMLIEHGPEYGF
jgi:hypothetical protein